MMKTAEYTVYTPYLDGRIFSSHSHKLIFLTVLLINLLQSMSHVVRRISRRPRRIYTSVENVTAMMDMNVGKFTHKVV